MATAALPDLSDEAKPDMRAPPLWIDTIPRCPAPPAAIALILGIFAHRAAPHHAQLWLLLAIIATVIAILSFQRRFVSSAAIAAAIFIAGVATAQVAEYFYPSDDIAGYSSDTPRLARLRVRVIDPPRTLQSPGFRLLPPKQVTIGTVTEVQTTTGWKPASGNILVQIDEPVARLAIGQDLEVIGMLQRPSPPMNPGQFDWEQYYREQRILTSINIPHGSGVRIVREHGHGPLDFLRAQARAALAAGFTKEQSIDLALLRALVLGDSDPELRDVQEDFRRTGTSHHLAISGMHIAVLGGVVYLICRLLRVLPRTSLMIATALVVIYGIVALPSPPVVRSVLLCLCIAIGLMQRRSIDAVQLLALTVIAMLVYHPLDLYNAGFLLSFGTVLGLMLFANPAAHWLNPIDIDEQVLLSLLGRRAPLRLRFKHWLKRHLAGIAAPGIVAWLVALPLIARHFEQLNPWAVFASILLAVPVLGALICGFLKIVLTLLIPIGATIWATMAADAVMLMRLSVQALAMLPGSEYPMPSPPLWLIAIYYALLAIPFLPFMASRWRERRLAWIGPAGALAALACLPLSGAFSIAQPSALKVTTLSLGAGLCCVVELPNRQTLLIDDGSATVTDLERRTIAPFRRHEGRASVDSIFLSHCDFDHIGGAADTVAAYDVPHIFISTEFQKYADGSRPAEELLAFFHDKRRTPSTICTGDTLDLSDGAKVEVLWPPRDCPLQSSNDTGLVLRLTYAGRSILFPADIQGPAETELLKHPEQLKSDILIAPHHGSGESTTPAFVRAVDPQFIISSNDRTLTRKQRLFDRMTADRKVYRTHDSGAVTAVITRDGNITVIPFRPQNR